MTEYTINGTVKQHKELYNWAIEYNEKMLAFITPLSKNNSEPMYPIIIMPENIDAWFEMNCFLDFVKEYYFERNGRESIYGGQD